MIFQGHGLSAAKMVTGLDFNFVFNKGLCLMKFSENELLRKDHTSSFLVCGKAGKRVLEFQANFSEVFEVLSSNDR